MAHSEEEMKEMARQLYEKRWSLKAISRTVGVSKKTLIEWGIDTRPKVGAEVPKKERHKYWTRERIIRAIQAWARQHDGAPPTSLEWKTGRGTAHPSYDIVRRRFGSIETALLEANLPRHLPNGRKFDREEAAELRRQGLTDTEIAARFGVSGPSIGIALGPRREFFKKKKMTTRAEREEALRQAIAREERAKKFET